MIRIILLVAVLIAGLVFGPEAAGNKGYVLIALGDYTVESSVTSLVILAILLYGVLLAVEWLLTRVLRLRRNTLGWFGKRRRNKANQQTVAATLAMAEGHYRQAEKLLVKSARNSDTPLLNYLGAAKAAQARGDESRRDEYLQLAQQESPKAELALTLTQTQLQIEQEQYEQALAALEPIYALHPRHPMVIEQLTRIHRARHDWPALIELLPVLRKVGRINAEREEALLEEAWNARLEAAGSELEPLRALWQEMPRKLRQQPIMLLAYGNRLRALGAESEAADLWLDALRKENSPLLLTELPRLKLDNYQTMLSQLRKMQDQPGARAALGQVALLAGELEEAQRLLEAELAEQPSAPVYYALARVMEQRRLTSKANEYYRLALELAIG
ncbi:heme biosynthesis HemY N-terminal domain-containing protein [Aeromonas simiae]|uniref:heme biosynthesis HemY N-terminal domain-containing protein n=1 Tax=Aeromonas simiae TaxID=218936 RepID=UPI0005A646AB|nr:heme biosynthesis HemY N-terminal domain-containing protein [Aeromonas simiae]MDO2949520.1 heme biosynthesis protein HemY [Aeromonas simiae]MDO2953184.1 heme biosynthesis protein HemY [Aeromonas simiae]MDO2956879.1 heme biosynthesis protein HemY [Aeromonas simiae]